jgi:hypothetical protein
MSYINYINAERNNMSNQIGNISGFEIKDNTLMAHGFVWNVQGVSEYDHKGNTRYSVKATKPKGRKVFTMVIYENGTISSAV